MIRLTLTFLSGTTEGPQFPIPRNNGAETASIIPMIKAEFPVFWGFQDGVPVPGAKASITTKTIAASLNNLAGL